MSIWYDTTGEIHYSSRMNETHRFDAAARQHASAVVAMASRPHMDGVDIDAIHRRPPVHGALSELQREDRPEAEMACAGEDPEHDATGIVWGQFYGVLLWAAALIFAIALYAVLKPA